MARTNVVRCVDENVKSEIKKSFDKKDFKTKTKLAEKYGISLRTLNRILKEKENGNEAPVSWDYTVTKDQVTIFKEEEVRSVNKGMFNFKEIKNTLVLNNFNSESLDAAWNMCCVKKQIEIFSEGNITVDYNNGNIKYGQFAIKHSLVDRILNLLEKGKDCLPIVRFLDKLMDNPDKSIIDQLYPFLKHNDIEINEEGNIVAWRGVTWNFKDKYTGLMDNSVGNTVKIPRHLVDTNPEETCSSGLHCAARRYAESWGDRLVKVLVEPKNVCSVPVDYDGQKMRVCEFKVLEEIFNKGE